MKLNTNEGEQRYHSSLLTIYKNQSTYLKLIWVLELKKLTLASKNDDALPIICCYFNVADFGTIGWTRWEALL